MSAAEIPATEPTPAEPATLPPLVPLPAVQGNEDRARQCGATAARIARHAWPAVPQ